MTAAPGSSMSECIDVEAVSVEERIHRWYSLELYIPCFGLSALLSGNAPSNDRIVQMLANARE